MRYPLHYTLLVVPLLLIASCAPGISPPGPDATPEEIAAYEAAIEDQELRYAWSGLVDAEALCTDEDGFVSDYIRTGANVCAIRIDAPHNAPDFRIGEYRVRLYYLVPVGTLLNPQWEDRYQEFSGELEANGQDHVITSFPWYVPETDPLKALVNIVASALDTAISNAGPLALALGVPYADLFPGTHQVDAESVEGLFVDVGRFAESLLGGGNRPHHAEIMVRACGERYCTDYGWMVMEVAH